MGVSSSAPRFLSVEALVPALNTPSRAASTSLLQPSTLLRLLSNSASTTAPMCSFALQYCSSASLRSRLARSTRAWHFSTSLLAPLTPFAIPATLADREDVRSLWVARRDVRPECRRARWWERACLCAACLDWEVCRAERAHSSWRSSAESSLQTRGENNRQHSFARGILHLPVHSRRSIDINSPRSIKSKTLPVKRTAQHVCPDDVAEIMPPLALLLASLKLKRNEIAPRIP